MPIEILEKKLEMLSEIQKQSVLDYINFLISQNSLNEFQHKKDKEDTNKFCLKEKDFANQRLEYLDSLGNKEITPRNIEEINQYIADIRNEERLF